MKALLLSLSLFAFSSNSPARLTKCAQILTRVDNHFAFHDPRPKLISVDSIFLGRGAWGKVYLRTDSSHNFYVEKIYGSDRQLRQDHRALQFLARNFKHANFSVAQSTTLDSLKLRLSYHPGRSVQDLTEDLHLPLSVRNSVKEAYRELIRSLTKFFQLEDFDFDLLEQSLPRISADNDSFGGGSIHFIIKPDNIIVDPISLNLTLIDPS